MLPLNLPYLGLGRIWGGVYGSGYATLGPTMMTPSTSVRGPVVFPSRGVQASNAI